MIKENVKPDMREKVKSKGAQYLSDSELIALALRTGTKEIPLRTLANSVIRTIDSTTNDRIFSELSKLDGMGETKAGAVAAAIELGRRYAGPVTRKVRTAADVFPLLQHYADRKQEQFLCVSLNGCYEVLGIRVVSVGILNKTIVHPREVFSDPLIDRAAAIIVAHNHPSGQLEPSDEDKQITRRLGEAGSLLGISVLDHLILSPRGGYFSFVEAGIMISL